MYAFVLMDTAQMISANIYNAQKMACSKELTIKIKIHVMEINATIASMVMNNIFSQTQRLC